MKNKTVFLVVILMQLASIFAMSNDNVDEPTVLKKEIEQTSEVADTSENNDKSSKTATIAELEGCALENVWPGQDNVINVVKYEEIKKDYINKAREMGVKNDRLTKYSYWKDRVNVNALDELRKLGSDTRNKEAQGLNVFDKAMLSQAVIIGKVINIEIDKRSKAKFRKSINIEVEEVIIGNKLYIDFPKSITLKIEKDFENYYNNEFEYVIGDKYLLFLTRTPLEDYSRMNKAYMKNQKIYSNKIELLPLDINNKHVFTPFLFSTINLKRINQYTNMLNKDLKTKYDLDSIKKKIKRIGELNDKANFFNRSYK